ncbi:hypothetical protein MKX08_009697 [Trichoderma sp. CBMAI-0020]|nr:hypothetical protein MKX08_009697 [Trichoderma sp. CBMAI-0020]
MPAINITTYVIQLLSMPLSVGMAKWLPRRTLTIRYWTFSLNPSRFNEKEHLLIAIMANVAFAGYMHGAYIASPIQVLSLDRFYGEKVLSNSSAWQITTFIATQMLGYGCAGISRRFLVSPPSMIWPRPLASIALTKALHKDDAAKDAQHAANGWTISRYRFFLISFWAMFVWYWVPNYIFQPFALFNWPTWFSPSNVKLAIITGSTCGLGLNMLPTLDWNVSTHFGDPIVTPLFTIVNWAFGMAFMGFFIAPIVYFNDAWHSGYLPINSNKVYDDSANVYDVRKILNTNMSLNKDKYEVYSVPWLSADMILKLGAFFMLYVAVPIQMFLWHRKQIIQGLRSIWDRKASEEDFNDVHNKLMQKYDKCPDWWYLIILAMSFVLACISVTVWPTGMPVWGVFIAVLFTVLLQIPFGMLTAITNIELPTSILSLLIGGYALEGKAIPNMVFMLYSYVSTSQALNFVADLKMAHYAKIPPRVVFAAQVYATLIAALGSSPIEKQPPTHRYVYTFPDRLRRLAATRSEYCTFGPDIDLATPLTQNGPSSRPPLQESYNKLIDKSKEAYASRQPDTLCSMHPKNKTCYETPNQLTCKEDANRFVVRTELTTATIRQYKRLHQGIGPFYNKGGLHLKYLAAVYGLATGDAEV